MKLLPAALGCLLLPLTLWCQSTAAPVVRFQTNLGDIDVNLTPDVAPKTVANFLNYVNRGAYNNSIFHRSVPGFIIQGGGYQLQNHAPVDIPQDRAVVNEFKTSNTRGTIAMAKLGSDPNSATNQWFFNLADNSKNLDNQNGGFTVFGRVANSEGLAVMDKIANQQVYNAGSPFDSLPLINYNGKTIQDQNFVLVQSVTVLNAAPALSVSSLISASAFGGSSTATAGSYLELYGTNLAGSTRQWGDSDFVNGTAPTSLDNVTATVNGQPAYVYYVSPTQVNIQVPSNVPSSGTVPVVITYNGQSSAAQNLTLQPTQPALLAPALFNTNGKQYVAALHANGTYVSNGSVSGVTAAPAIPGETLVFYGLGFGPVTPGSTAIAGQIASGQTTLSSPVQFSFGGTAAQVAYQGLAPGFVGLYQFNVVVPANVSAGDVPLTVTQAGTGLSQTLFVPVQAAP